MRRRRVRRSLRRRMVRSKRRRILMRMRWVMRKRSLMMRRGRNTRIQQSLMRISERLWESHNRRYLERMRKGRRSLRRRRRKVNYN